MLSDANSLTDPRLTRGERRYLEALGQKLKPAPRQPLPEGYKRALDEAFGSCGEGERDRWQPTPRRCQGTPYRRTRA